MQSFPDMAEAHAWTLQRLREMAGRLTEQAYHRALETGPKDPEDAQRWMLVFDRMSRGLRLTMALEAKLARERRWDADEIMRGAEGERRTPRWRRPAPPGDAEPAESDHEADYHGLPADAPLAERIGRLKSIIEAAGATSPAPVRYRFEERALEPQRAERARLAGEAHAPHEPWDFLSPETGAQEKPWRGSG